MWIEKKRALRFPTYKVICLWIDYNGGDSGRKGATRKVRKGKGKWW
jgi:hypothetical protein